MNTTPDVPETAGEPEPTDAAPEEAVETEPLNRAARRARAKQDAPSHVGPQAGRNLPGVRAGRPRTKRRH